MGDFFSRLEASASESPGAVLFLLRSSSFMETLAPSVRMGSVGGPRPPVLSSPVTACTSHFKRSLGIELPQAKRPVFARLDLTNQHNLYYRNQTEISIEEISNAALQYRHVLGWTPAQTSTDP